MKYGHKKNIGGSVKVEGLASRKLLQSTGSSAQCSVMAERGGMEGGSPRGDICMNIAD